MAVETVRVTLLPRDADAEAAGDRQIILDLNRDTESHACTGPFPAFGRVGDFRKPETLYPFTLMFDERMDYGAHASDAQRQDRLEIRAATIVAGAEIGYRAGDDMHGYRIETVAALLG